jgi:TonB-dependent SusC/RagA subfamily outer membrane receptor
VALLGFTARVEAQSTGTLSGRVIDASTLQPLPSVQISLGDTGMGTSTDTNGQYQLADVPPGSYELRAELIGYQVLTRSVEVVADESVVVNFTLESQALQLDALVVTGTPGGTRQRAIGNVVGTVDAAAIQEVAPVQNFQDLLAGREPGVDFLRSSGNVGTGSAVRIRGFSSLNVGNQPLIYVDGIRVDNSANAGPNLRDGAQVSKLDDINPEDIESIEVIKGPAAATLYGTEASNGVIQIITKRGAEGRPQLSVSVRQGGTWLANPEEKVPTAYGIGDGGDIISFNIWDQESAAGRPFFSTGHTQAYTVSVRGGTELVRYYLSGDFDDQTGIVDYNTHEALNLRANLSIVPNDQLSLDASMGYVDSETGFMQQRTGWGLWEQAQWSSPEGRDTELRGFLRARPEQIANVEAIRDNSRFIASGTLNFTPTSWLSNRLIVGLDVANEENRSFFPRDDNGDFGGLSLGFIEVNRPSTNYTTLDFASSAEWGLSDNIRMTSSAGVQYYAKRVETIFTEGREFPAPSIRSLAGAAVAVSNEQILENKTLGAYVQQEVAINDRIFLTAAVRGDDNSAFGTDFDAIIYPKFSATWVASEESFWNWDLVNSLRFRSAWGQAGQQPDVFAAARLYAPGVGPGNRPVVSPDEIGNPELGPEVATELEVGFDAALLDDRFAAEFTYFNQSVEDALVSLPVSPSVGFPGNQFVNLGQVRNQGVEVSLNGRVFETSAFSWDLGVIYGWVRNEVIDAGGRPPTLSIREGFPFPAFFAEKIVSADLDAQTGRAVNIMCDGGTGLNGMEAGGAPIPCSGPEAPEVYLGPGYYPHTARYNTTMTFFNDLRLTAMVEHNVGAYQFAWDMACRHTCFRTSLAANERNDPIFLGYADTGISDRMLGAYDASFARLREVGLSYQIPDRWIAGTGAERASLSIAGRNLWTIWRAQEDVFGTPIPDPEMRRAVDAGTTSNSNVPPLSSFLITLRVSF